ncbi:galactoside 2-alpha-L-fucosyltransferase [Ricinus communis]|uniref:galactoside 2-alpha-L-fucosyltransferase n=1 Tax=Ricinus communis TaxID=3988 RepID=UPI00201A5BAD|nr:galactoside 2-alpha-L-fucosyltransferase [Ricinus communis]
MVWIGHAGLGNRILTMASAFLYALLTNQTLLVQHDADMADLFCEPFPNTSWLLPPDFTLKNELSKVVMDQILACTKQEYLLPEVDKEELVASRTKSQTPSKAILIASLYSEFYENLKYMYWTFPTKKGEAIEVYQPAHEEYQHFGDNMHNVKAWVEMNLLSLSDVLVTTSWSTFRYVAQGLGGLKPWILYRPENWKNTDPACYRVTSMEPCLHIPPSFDCKTKVNADMGNVVPYVKHCEDVT